jgi:CDP-diacylglycerol--glycerol-3-phosphate 3-phosphatidyltransferase
MLNILARASVSRFTVPTGSALVRLGLTPNAVTLTGTILSAGCALWFFPRGQLFLGAVLVAIFLLFDVLDGAMARVGGRATAFGGVLDATCDRIVDGALFGSLVWWAFQVGRDTSLGLALLICLVSAQVISYVKARAEANGLVADGGLAERAERLVIILIGSGLHGLGVPYILDVAAWLLVALCLFTVAQRLHAVYRSGYPGRER